MKSGPNGLEIVDRAIHLLRAQPASVWVIQFAGAVPLLLSALFFLLDATPLLRSAEHLASGSLLCAACLLWFNVCRSRFAQQLLASLSGEERGSWKAAAAPVPLALQSAKLIVMPLAFAAVVPWPWAVAFFRTLPLVDGSWSRASRLARVWTAQNWIALALSSLLTGVVFLNVLVLVVILPQLLRIFTGMQNELTRSTGNPLNIAAAGIAVALTWFTLDPLYQAVYAVRCFLGDARETGADLRVAIRRLVILVLLAAPFVAQASEPPRVTPQELDAGIHAALEQPEYAWSRRTASPAADNFLTRTARTLRHAMSALSRQLKRFLDWLFHRRTPTQPGEKTPARLPSAGWTIALLLLALAGTAGFALLRLRFARRAPVPAPAVTQVVAAPDLESEGVSASDLPEDRWLELARDCLLRGEHRPALRAFYLANLSFLSRRELLTIGRSKSNLDYARELRRRAHDPDLDRAFRANIQSFERGWYGLHPVAAPQIEEFASTFEEIKSRAGA